MIILLLFFALKKLKELRERIDTPFEPLPKRRILPSFNMKSRMNRFIAAIIILVVAASGIIIVGQLPIHRTDIEHPDPVGDVTDGNIDIVRIKSYLNGSELFLQLTVAGSIVENHSHWYTMTITGKTPGQEHGSNLLHLSYENGEIVNNLYGARCYTNGTTVTMVVPISQIASGYYMTGLEGAAQSNEAEDYTGEDKDGEIPHLLF